MINKIKYLILGALIISSVLIVSAAVTIHPNDYVAYVQQIVDMKPNLTDTSNSSWDWSYNTLYMPLITGSPTYTYSMVPMTVTVDYSQPANIKPLIKAKISNWAITHGYDLKKDILPSFSVENP